MKSIKITPFQLFLILLVGLVITIIICRKYCNKNIFSNEEGFVVPSAFKGTVHIDNYGESDYLVHKLDETLYFDKINGNLIEVVGSSTASEFTISELHITTRPTSAAGTTTNVTTQSYTPPSDTITPSSTLNQSYTSYLYNSKDSSSGLCVLYIPWYDQTYLHIMDTVSKTHLRSFCFNSTVTQDVAIIPAVEQSFIDPLTYTPENTNNYGNNTIYEPMYNDKVLLYSICNNVLFDIKKANLIVKVDEVTGASPVPRKVVTYKQNGDTTTYDATNHPRNNVEKCNSEFCGSNISAFTSKIVNDVNGQNMVVKMNTGNKTIIAAICKDDSGSSDAIKIRNIVRFNEKELALIKLNIL